MPWFLAAALAILDDAVAEAGNSKVEAHEASMWSAPVAEQMLEIIRSRLNSF